MKHCTIAMMAVGDGQCIGLMNDIDPWWENALIDCGSDNPETKAVSALRGLGLKASYYNGGFPSSFILSHYHADHYNGLVSASEKLEFQQSWGHLEKVYTPGLPIIPDRVNYYKALFSLNQYILGSRSGFMEYDFINVIRRLITHPEKCSHRRLFQGDDFIVNNQMYHCIWPPKRLFNAQLNKRIKNALDSYSSSLEQFPELRQIENRIKNSPWFHGTMGDSDEEIFNDYEHFGQNNERNTNELLNTLLPPLIKTTNEKLRKIANDLCLSFIQSDKLVFWGDLSPRYLGFAAKYLEGLGNINFRIFAASHHGTKWNKKLFNLRAKYTLVSNGKRLVRNYRQEYGQISEYVLSTFTSGDIFLKY